MVQYKVAFLTTSFPQPEKPYVSPFVKHLFDAIQEEGDNPILVMPMGYKQLMEDGGILQALTKGIMKKIIFGIFTLHFLFLIIKKAPKCDIIHANWSYSGFLAAITKWIHRKKIILTCRSSALIYTNNPILKRFINWTYNHVAYLVLLSKPVSEDVKKRYNLKHNNVTYVHNGVSIHDIRQSKQELRKKLKIPKDALVYLFVGRIIAGKGVDLLLESFNHLYSQKKQSPILYIVGDGELTKELEIFVREHKLESKVYFTGNKNSITVQSYMKAADACFHPSSFQTDGNGVIEATAIGIPLVTTDTVWGQLLVQPGVNGYVLPKGDKKKLTEYMKKIETTYNVLAKKSIPVAKKIREEMTWQYAAKQYHELYKAVTSE